MVSFESHSGKSGKIGTLTYLGKIEDHRIATSKLAEINGIQKPRVNL